MKTSITPRSPSSALLPFLWEGSPTKIDYKKQFLLTSPLEDLDSEPEGKLVGHGF